MKRRCAQKKDKQVDKDRKWKLKNDSLAYPGCSFPHHCGPCSPTHHRSASAEGCSERDSGRGTRPPGTPSHSQSVGRETLQIIKIVPFSDVVSCYQRKTQTLNDSCFNLD